MRYLPHTLDLMSLRGRKTIRGRPLPSADEAHAALVRLTSQDFGLDAARWAAWIKQNRKGLYGRPPGRAWPRPSCRGRESANGL